MEISQKLVAFMAREESIEPKVYPDPVGLPTIGIGHKLTQSELYSGKLTIGSEVVRWKEGLTEAQIDRLLRQDLAWAMQAVYASVRVPLTQGQYEALVSLCFNIGASAFTHSTLVRLLNQGDYASVPDQMRRWHHAAGVDLAGLKKRREKEIQELWLRSEEN